VLPLNTSPLPSVVLNRSLSWTKWLVCADAKIIESHRDIDVAVLRACCAAPEPSFAYYAAQFLGGFFLAEISQGD
jgi:hypothetical protein